MYWQEDSEEDKRAGTDAVVDLVFKMRCRSLPVDHAHILSEALLTHLPWLKGTKGAGIHPISIPETGNGWMRPEGEDELLHLSRRTKLILRAPMGYVDEAAELVGKTILVAENELEVLSMEQRPLLALETLFSLYNIVEEGMDEDAFMRKVLAELKALDISPRKMLPGKSRSMRGANGRLNTLSLMIAELTHEESLKIQHNGIGQQQHMGCGLFIPQKGIAEVHDILD